MANTLPAPTEGLVYTNPTTGKRMKFSDGCWKSIDYLPLDGSDSMQGTLWTPDQLINGNILTADPPGTDPDWVAWTSTNASDNWAFWKRVAYGEVNGVGRFVAVSTNASNKKKVMYSDDGINWTAVETPDNITYYGIAYGDGRFVATSITGTKRSMYSEDGINWTAVSTPQSNNWEAVAYGDGKFVAVASTGSIHMMYSTNGGSSWQSAASSSTTTSITGWRNVAYGNGMWVAVATGGSSQVAYSTDGINWNDAIYPWNSAWYGVTYGDGKFVAVANNGTQSDGSDSVMYSEDGITWTAVPTPKLDPAFVHNWQCVSYGGGYFIAGAINSGGSVYNMMHSPDGINWEFSMSPIINAWQDLAYGDGKFVAVASDNKQRAAYLTGIESGQRQGIYFNGDPVVIDTGLQGSLATQLSTQSRELGRMKFYQDSALLTGDSYDYPDGSLWYQPSSNNLHFYNDSDQTWVQL